MRTTPFVAEIGDDIELAFYPELDTEEILEPYRKLVEATAAADWSNLQSVPPDQLAAMIGAIKAMLRSLMMPQSIEVFERKKIPDRVLGEVFMWLVEQYGEEQRPTSPSSDSSPSPLATGVGSTGS